MKLVRKEPGEFVMGVGDQPPTTRAAYEVFLIPLFFVHPDTTHGGR
jgi:hypothetical protein